MLKLLLFDCEDGQWYARVLLVLFLFVTVAMLHTKSVKEQRNIRNNNIADNDPPRTNNVSIPYDSIAQTYDATFCDTLVGTLLRRQTRAVLKREFVLNPLLQPDAVVLEISCGTGIDALWLAEQHRIRVIATDISEGMLQRAQLNLQQSSHLCHDEEWKPIFQKLDIQNLEKESSMMFQQHHIIGVFSNFGGMNNVSPDCVRCTAKLLGELLPPGARVILVIMGRFCLVETLYYLFVKFNFQRAFRRMRTSPRQGIAVRIGSDENHKVYFHSMEFVQEAFLATSMFRLTERRAIGLTLPPSLWSNSASRKVPRWLLSILDAIDTLLCRFWPFVNCGDHYLVEFERIDN
jgi:SAM-dependent methyltransferase